MQFWKHDAESHTVPFKVTLKCKLDEWLVVCALLNYSAYVLHPSTHSTRITCYCCESKSITSHQKPLNESSFLRHFESDSSILLVVHSWFLNSEVLWKLEEPMQDIICTEERVIAFLICSQNEPKSLRAMLWANPKSEYPRGTLGNIAL